MEETKEAFGFASTSAEVELFTVKSSWNINLANRVAVSNDVKRKVETDIATNTLP
jgi:hypothetical protein